MSEKKPPKESRPWKFRGELESDTDLKYRFRFDELDPEIAKEIRRLLFTQTGASKMVVVGDQTERRPRVVTPNIVFQDFDEDDGVNTAPETPKALHSRVIEKEPEEKEPEKEPKE